MSSSSSLVSTPSTKRRNTMPSSMSYRATSRSGNDLQTSLNSIKPDLYNSEWSLGRGVDHCLSPSQEDLGDLVYSIDADCKTTKDRLV